MKVYDGTSAEPAPEPEPERRKVGIAEYDVTTDGAVLTTSGLGSCIGVALYDATSALAGLVHVMLPLADEVADDNAAKFADAGTELLVEKLVEAGASRAGLQAKIAGGSDMLDFAEEGDGIGQRNARVVRDTLGAHDIPVVAEDVGGDHGRSLRLEVDTGDLVVKCANRGSRRL